MFDVLNVEFYDSIKELINESRKSVASYVNTTLLFVHWNIGKRIVEEQGGEERAKYGNKIIEELSKKLTHDFGKGFDQRNLRFMRQFYITFPIWNSVSAKLSWTHYRTLLRVSDSNAREFYITEAIKGNWSVRQLERQISTHTYNRLISHSINNVDVLDVDEKSNSIRFDPNMVIKDPYILEFLGLDNKTKYLERDLEDALISHLQKFILELGRGFCFVERQKRISNDSDHYFIDLVFYNSILKCYVLIDLKTEKVTYKSLGQMDMYRNYFDMEIKREDDNPTIGLLLVTDNDNFVAKYSSVYQDHNIFVSKYMTYLLTEEELKQIVQEERKFIEEYKKNKEEKTFL